SGSRLSRSDDCSSRRHGRTSRSPHYSQGARRYALGLGPPGPSDHPVGEGGHMSQGGSTRRRGATWTAYYFVYDPAGRRVQKSKGGFRTKKDAQTFLATALAGLNAGTYTEPSKLRL